MFDWGFHHQMANRTNEIVRDRINEVGGVHCFIFVLLVNEEALIAREGRAAVCTVVEERII